MYQFGRIARLDFFNLAANPMWVFFSAPFPFLMVLILGFLSSGTWGNAVSAYDYYGVTILIYAILNTATISANSFMEERIKGGNLRIIHAPIRPFAIHFSKTIASAAFCGLCHLVTAIALHLSVGAHYGDKTILEILAVLVLLEFFSSALGVALCSIFRSEGIANQILSLLVTAIAVLGGLFFRVDGLGQTIARVSDFCPTKWVSKVAFRLIWDGDGSLVAPVSASLLIAGAGLVLLSTLVFKTEDYI